MEPKTAPTTELSKKLLEFQKKVQPVIKDAKNPFYNNNPYATLPNVLGVVKPILSELGLLLSQPISNGCVHSIITDTTSGETISSEITLPVGLDAQKIGSAITYFRRYTLISVLSLEIEDDDGNGATPNSKPNPAPESKQQEDNRPWINDKAVAQAIERIKTGEAGVIDKCKAAFKISKANMEKLTKAMEGK